MITQLTVDREIEKLFTEIKQKTATRPTDLKYESKLANQITRLENKIDYYNSVRRYLESKKLWKDWTINTNIGVIMFVRKI